VKRKAVGHGGIYLLEIAGAWRKEGMEKGGEKRMSIITNS